MAPNRIIVKPPKADNQPEKAPDVSAVAHGFVSRVDRRKGASLIKRRRRSRGSGRYAVRRTA